MKRPKTHPKEIESVIKLPYTRRYEIFVKTVADWGVVWGLYNDGWAVGSDGAGNLMLPFWPKFEYAEICALGNWAGCTPAEIPLKDFMEAWLPGIEKDGNMPSIFPVPDNGGAAVNPSQLREDLLAELSRLI